MDTLICNSVRDNIYKTFFDNTTVSLNNRCTLQTYINYKKILISSSFDAINKVKGVLSRTHLTSLYYALVYHHLLYGITMWGNTCQVYLTKLMTKIVRCIADAY